MNLGWLNRSRWAVGITLVLLVLVLADGRSPEAAARPLTSVTVQLKWLHQAQFAGFYAAEQNGYYAAEGLAVTLVPGGPEVDFVAEVAEGRAQFGVTGADDLILRRDQGIPIRAIAALYRRSPIVFISRAELGITRPQDFVGKRIRVVPSHRLTFQAMMASVGVTPDQYDVVYLPSSLEDFIEGNAEVWDVYISGLVVSLRRAGYDLSLVFPDDYGVHFYADTLFTTDQLIAENPDLASRFLRATLKGWRYAVENPRAVGLLVTIYAPESDPEVEGEKMVASIPLVHTGHDAIGWMRPEVWGEMARELYEQGVLDYIADSAQVYTLRFLEESYPP